MGGLFRVRERVVTGKHSFRFPALAYWIDFLTSLPDYLIASTVKRERRSVIHFHPQFSSYQGETKRIKVEEMLSIVRVPLSGTKQRRARQ